jgi:hypothetical protein
MQEIFILSVSFVVYLPCIPFEAVYLQNALSLCIAESSKFPHADVVSLSYFFFETYLVSG